MHCCTQCPQPWPMPLLEMPGHSRASLGQSLVESQLLSPQSWCTHGFLRTLQESVSPVLCKFWWLYGGVNGDFLQKGLCHTQIYCTQSPCQFGRPLLTHTSTGDYQRQVWLSLCGVSWCAQCSVWAPQVSLVGMGFDSKCNLAPPNIFLGLLLCPWTWGIFLGWDPTFSCGWFFGNEL